MRLPFLRVLSYLLLILIVAAAVIFRDLAAEQLFKNAGSKAESVSVENTLSKLNTLYEQQLKIRMDELEKQRIALQAELQKDNTAEISPEVQRKLQQLQEEKARLEGEIDNVRIEAQQLQKEQIVPVSDDLQQELSAAEVQIQKLMNENSRLEDLIAQLTSSLENRDGEAGALRSESDRLAADLEEQKRLLENSLRTNKALNAEILELRTSVKTGPDDPTRSDAEVENLKSRIGQAAAENQRLKSAAADLQSRIDKLTADSAALTEELSLKNSLLAAQEAERLEKEESYELQISQMKTDYDKAAANAAKTAAAQLGQAVEQTTEEFTAKIAVEEAYRRKLDSVTEKLFAASDIRGIFINDPEGSGLLMIVNPLNIAEATDSPFVSVFTVDGTEISKIILSGDNGDYNYRVYPGYPSPVEGNWF